MPDVHRRGFNTAITRFWSFAAPAYNLAPLQRWVYQPAQDEVIAQLRSHDSRRIVDVACGTGILADRVQRELPVDEVYGVDMSEGMLSQARSRSSAVRWLAGPAERLPFDDNAVDAVVTTSAFHFFDQPAALREFRRVVVPGGLVAVATISPPCPAPLDRLSKNVRNPAHNPSSSEMRTLFDDAGLSITDQHRVRRPAWTALIFDLITVGTSPD